MTRVTSALARLRGGLRRRPLGGMGAFGAPVRLSSRMAAWSLGLLLLLQLASFGALRAGIDASARRALAAELAVGERLWSRLLEQRASKLQQGASLLAADYGFRAALASDDRDTIVSALDNHGARIGAAVALLLDTRMAVHASSAAASAGASAAPALPSDWPSLRPRLSRDGTALALVHDRPYQFVMVPVRAPLVVGWVVMGFEVDAAVVRDLQAVSGLHGALVAHAPTRAPALLHASRDGAQALAAADASEVRLGDGPYLLRRVALASSGDTHVELRLAGSLADAVAPFHAVQMTLAALTALGLLLFAAGSVWTARRVTQPLRALVAASDRLARGDYDTPLADASTARGVPDAASTDHAGTHRTTAAAAVRRRDEVGELAVAFEHMRRSVAAQRREIHDLAYRDRLTGLPNRLQFREAVAARLAAGESLAVLTLDLDRFKHVNDVLGYAFGDRLLAVVAARLAEVTRPGDLLARLGGDEFALLLPGGDGDVAMSVAARIARAFERPLALDEQRVDLSAGIGVACAPQHAADADTLLSRAEVAMYAAKHSTAGAVHYDESLDSASAENLSLLSELRRAIDHDELRLYLQPKVALPAGVACGAEALVRWQHPERGLVPPARFIPYAERTGFVRQLTLWVFEEAARRQTVLRALGVERVSVNLSTRDLIDGELPEKLQAALARHGARADGLCLEITESAIMDDPARAEATLNRLAQAGFRLSIDDFGTGYSSLAYLSRLPVRELKIDRGFVTGMMRNARDLTIVRSTIDLAHNLGLAVVAEGVEDAATLQRLGELGCDEAQGYHLGRPMPPSDLQAWMAQRATAHGASATRADPAREAGPVR